MLLPVLIPELSGGAESPLSLAALRHQTPPTAAVDKGQKDKAEQTLNSLAHS